MDYEKEYKKRLDDARYWHDVSEGDIPAVLEEIFSELRESEDEKIKKVIIGLLKQSTYEDCVYDGVNMKDIYAWLEKQGKETSWKPSKEDDVRRRSTIQTLEYARSLDIYNQYGKADIDKNIAWLEKQGEQKLPIEKLPEEMKTIGESLGFTTQEECDEYNQIVSGLIMSDDNKEEQKQNVNNKKLTDVNHEYYSELLKNDRSDNIADYAYQCVYCMSHDWTIENPTWDNVQSACRLGAKWQKKHNVSEEWSEEDENTIKVLMNIIRKSEIIDSIIYTDSLKEKLYDWLKSLKDIVQPQPKPKWSEEDERRINRISDFIWKNRKGDTDEIYQQEQDVDWLKSLKQRIGE